MGFLAIGVTALAGLFGVTVSAAVAGQIGLSIALTAVSIGASLVARLLAGQKPLEALDGPTHTIKGEVVNARWVLGKRRVPGVLCYFGSQDREARMGLVLSEGECEGLADDGMPERANRAVVWIDGKAVRLAREARAGGKGDKLTPLSGSKYSGYIEVYEYFAADGTQGADMRQPDLPPATEFQDEYGSWSDEADGDTEYMRPSSTSEAEPFRTPYPAWTTSHKLRGLSWVFVKLTQPEYGQDRAKRLWTKVPNLEFLVKGIKISRPGQAVPRWTDNAAALRYWWETERRGRPADAIDLTDFSDAYNLSEQTVDATNKGESPLPAGYEDFEPSSKRCAVNGVITAGDDVSQVEDQLDAAWAGEVIEAGGKLRFRPGAPRPATEKLVLAEADIVSPPSVQPWPALQERVNAVTSEIAQSSHPKHQWTKLSLPEYVDSYDDQGLPAGALERDGVKRSGNIRLAYVTDPIAAGRLQAVNLRRARESLRLEVTVTPGDRFERLALFPTEVVKLTLSEFGFEDKLMEVEGVSIRRDWSVTLTLREVLDDTYGDTLVLPALTSRVIRLLDEQAVPDVAGLAADEIAAIDLDGKTVIYLLLSWTPRAARETEVEVREKANAGETAEAWTSGVSLGANFRFSPVVVNQTYEIRARHVNREGVSGEWSSTIEHTVGGDVTPPGAITDLRLFSAPGGIRATWANPGDADFGVACVYVGTTDTFTDADLVATLDADLYETSGWTAGTEYRVWVLAKDLSGNTGAAGGPELVTPTTIAEESARILYGTDDPDDTDDGKAGDLYVQADGLLWSKAGGTWTDTGIDLTGNPGSSIHRVTSWPPDAALGGDGDVAIADDGQWGERVSGAWRQRGDLTGPIGSIGPKGPTGDQGLRGPQGPDGDIGPQGNTGDQGLRGEQGPKGDIGPPGNTGDQGLRGEQGPEGDFGPKGNEGPQGAAGSPGADGDQVFVYYTNAPADTDSARLAPLAKLTDGRWTTASGYYWHADAGTVPDGDTQG